MILSDRVKGSVSVSGLNCFNKYHTCLKKIEGAYENEQFAVKVWRLEVE